MRAADPPWLGRYRPHAINMPMVGYRGELLFAGRTAIDQEDARQLVRIMYDGGRALGHAHARALPLREMLETDPFGTHTELDAEQLVHQFWPLVASRHLDPDAAATQNAVYALARGYAAALAHELERAELDAADYPGAPRD